MAGKTKVYLIGFMGSGKTTAGKEIASLLGWEFADLDRIVEGKIGMSIPEIFSSRGEEYFRKAESEALRDVEIKRRIVVATGGGAPCWSDNMERMLATGLVIYLKLSPEQLLLRIRGTGDERPLIKGMEDEKLSDYIGHKLAEREIFYEKADIITDGYSPDTLAIAENIRSFFPSAFTDF